MVFQNYALYPQKTVFKNLAFPLQMRKLAKRRDRQEGARSGQGARHHASARAAAARAVRRPAAARRARPRAGARPAVFLMDEPLSNLDAKLRVQMRSEIKRFHQDLNATIVYVTHDQLEAVTMADKMAVMHGGLLQQYDTPANVFANPVNTFVASFVGSPAMSLDTGRGDRGKGGDTVLQGRRGWEPAALRHECAQGAALAHRQGGARRAPLDDQAAQVGRRRAPCPARSTRSSPPATSPLSSVLIDAALVNISLAPRSRSRPTSGLDRVRPGPDAPVRRRDPHGAEGG